MSRFYGQVLGNSETPATRCGNFGIKACAQSYSGSVITRLYYSGDVLCVEIQANSCSATQGDTLFSGTFNEFVDAMRSLSAQES